MQILDKYFFKNYLKVFLAALILLTGIGLIAKVNDTLRFLGEYQGPLTDIILMYAHSIPSFFTYIIPPALLFAISFTMSQFIATQEVTVILAAGRSYRRILMPMLIFSLFFSLAFFFINEYLAFPGAYRSYNYLNKIRGRGEGWRYGSSHFRNVALIFGNRYYTLGRILVTEKKIIGFHLIWLSRENIPKLILEAETAIFDEKSWNFEKALLTMFDEKGEFLKQDEYPSLAFAIPESLADFTGGLQTTGPDERNIFELIKIISYRKKTGSKYDAFATEFWWHVSYPLICFFVTFMGGFLAISGGKLGNRQSRTSLAGSIGLAMVFTIAYFFIMYFGTALGDAGIIPPILAANIANLISVFLCIYLYRKAPT